MLLSLDGRMERIVLVFAKKHIKHELNLQNFSVSQSLLIAQGNVFFSFIQHLFIKFTNLNNLKRYMVICNPCNFLDDFNFVNFTE